MWWLVDGRGGAGGSGAGAASVAATVALELESETGVFLVAKNLRISIFLVFSCQVLAAGRLDLSEFECSKCACACSA